jgi:hypothetical protein
VCRAQTIDADPGLHHWGDKARARVEARRGYPSLRSTLGTQSALAEASGKLEVEITRREK